MGKEDERNKKRTKVKKHYFNPFVTTGPTADSVQISSVAVMIERMERSTWNDPYIADPPKN